MLSDMVMPENLLAIFKFKSVTQLLTDYSYSPRVVYGADNAKSKAQDSWYSEAKFGKKEIL